MAEIFPTRQRDNEIDAIRGMAILLVVIGHVIQYQNPASYENNLLFRIIYSFHMPLFFFVSGVVTRIYGRMADLNLQLFMRRTRTLLYPWGVWTLFLFTLLYIKDPTTLPFERAVEFYWFLPVLFICHVASFVLIVSHKVRVNWYAIVLSVTITLFLMLMQNEFWISSIRFHAVYFVTGFFAATYFCCDFRIDAKGLLLPVILLIALILWYFLFDVASIRNTIPKYLYFLIRAFAAMFGIISVWIAVTYLPKNIKLTLGYFGRYSLQIYLIHLAIIQFIAIPPGYLSIAFWLIFLLSISLVIGVLFKRIGCSAILFGR